MTLVIALPLTVFLVGAIRDWKSSEAEKASKSPAQSDQSPDPGAGEDSPRALSPAVASSRRVARTYEELTRATAERESPETTLLRVLDAVEAHDLVVGFPTYEDERLRAEFDRIQREVAGAPASGARVDDRLVLHLAAQAELPIRRYFERAIGRDDASVEFASHVDRALAPSGLDRRTFSRELGPEGRSLLVYFLYRFALVHRTRVLVRAAGSNEARWGEGISKTPVRAHLPAPTRSPAPAGPTVEDPPRVEDPPPRVEDPPPRVEDPPPRVEDPPPRVEDPPARRPIPEIGTSISIDELREILAGREPAELRPVLERLRGVGLSGTARFVRYGNPRREFQDITLDGSEPGEDWTIPIAGKTAVPADDRLAARTAAGSRLVVVAQVLEAEVVGKSLRLSVRFHRISTGGE